MQAQPAGGHRGRGHAGRGDELPAPQVKLLRRDFRLANSAAFLISIILGTIGTVEPWNLRFMIPLETPFRGRPFQGKIQHAPSDSRRAGRGRVVCRGRHQFGASPAGRRIGPRRVPLVVRAARRRPVRAADRRRPGLRRAGPPRRARGASRAHAGMGPPIGPALHAAIRRRPIRAARRRRRAAAVSRHVGRRRRSSRSSPMRRR